MVSAIPEGCSSVIPYLVVPDAVAAMEFYGKAFGAEQIMHMPGPGGQGTMHAEMRVHGSTVMLTDENPQWGAKSPATLGGSPVSLHLYVEDADGAFRRAVEAGCEVEAPLMDAFWGDRYGKVKDPYGHSWAFATHVEDVPPEEMGQRAAEWMKSMAGECEQA